MRKLIYVLVIVSLITFSLSTFADEFSIPFSVYPKQLQAKFKEHNLKLDLSGNDRTEDSFGFILNKGTSFSIFTYFNLTDEQMDVLLDILLEE